MQLPVGFLLSWMVPEPNLSAMGSVLWRSLRLNTGIPEPNLSVLYGPWRTEHWKFKFWAGKVMKDWTLEVQNFWAVVFKYKINWCVFREFKEIVKLKVFRIMARLNNWNKNWCKCGDFIVKCDTTRGKGRGESYIVLFHYGESPVSNTKSPACLFLKMICVCVLGFLWKRQCCVSHWVVCGLRGVRRKSKIFYRQKLN